MLYLPHVIGVPVVFTPVAWISTAPSIGFDGQQLAGADVGSSVAPGRGHPQAHASVLRRRPVAIVQRRRRGGRRRSDGLAIGILHRRRRLVVPGSIRERMSPCRSVDQVGR